MFHLTAEAKSLPSAQELIADYGGLVRRYIQDPCAPLEIAARQTTRRWALKLLTPTVIRGI